MLIPNVKTFKSFIDHLESSTGLKVKILKMMQ